MQICRSKGDLHKILQANKRIAGDFVKLSCEFRMMSLAFLVCLLIFSSAGCSNYLDVNQRGLQGYPIASDVLTTLQRTVVPDPVPSSAEKIYPYEVSKYEKNGYGKWHYGPGLPYVERLDLMSNNYNATPNNNTTELLRFFTISNIHITDKQSPAQTIYFGYKGGVSSSYSPVMLYTTQVLDAAIQTINVLQKEKPFDLGITLGDDCNSAEYNEIRWFIDVLDGRNINPNSDPGIKEDPVHGSYNDYQDEYKAAGLNESIKWYAVLGNHDHFWMGVNPVDDYLRGAYIFCWIGAFYEDMAKQILGIPDKVRVAMLLGLGSGRVSGCQSTREARGDSGLVKSGKGMG
jgi:hypothetical protein